MKKIITLIMMFVLSVGFLTAQQKVFTYQAIVVDDEGNLIVDQDVNATVTVRYGDNATWTETINGVHSSPNGLVALDFGSFIDDIQFSNIDWRTATIRVQFTPVDPTVTIPAAEFEPVPGVPYALQSADDMLTTEMIADYYGRATTTMDDMDAILAALESNTPLSEGFRDALIDTIIHNRMVAKQILLHYLNTGTAADVQALYDAFAGNDEVKEAFLNVLEEVVQANREWVYSICRQYALQMTSDEVDEMFDAVSDEVKAAVIERALLYAEDAGTDPEKKANLIIPIMMNFMQDITTTEFDMLIQTLIDNTPVYNVMLNQFNKWLDEYFQNRFSGGNSVKNLVENVIEENYYAQCSPAIDLCELKENLEELNTCFDLVNNLVISYNSDNGDYEVNVLDYTGTADPTSASYVIEGQTTFDGPISGSGTATIYSDDNHIWLEPISNYIPGQLMPNDWFKVTVTILIPDCPDSTKTVEATFIGQ